MCDEERFSCTVYDTELFRREVINDNFNQNTFDDVDTVTELLNQFNNENIILKKENLKMKKQLGYLFDVVDAVLPHSGSKMVLHKLRMIE